MELVLDEAAVIWKLLLGWLSEMLPSQGWQLGAPLGVPPEVPTHDFSVWPELLRDSISRVSSPRDTNRSWNASSDLHLRRLRRISCHLQHIPLVKPVIKTSPDWRVRAMDSTSVVSCKITLQKSAWDETFYSSLENTFCHRTIWGTTLLCLWALPLSGFPESSALVIGVHYQVWIDMTASGYQPCVLVSFKYDLNGSCSESLQTKHVSMRGVLKGSSVLEVE